MEQEKPKRFRKWCARNSDALVVGGIWTGTLALASAFCVWAYRQDMAQQAELEKAEKDWYDGIRTALSNGQQIIPNRDGSYWVVEPTEKV